MADETITEFEELDPQEIHLVPAGANGFPFLLAKAVGDAISEEQRSQKEKQNTMSTETTGVPIAGGASTITRGDPFAALVSQIEEARKAGRQWEVVEKTAELAKARFVAAERMRQTPEGKAATMSRFGPGSTPLIVNRNALKDDGGISYV